VLELSLTCTCRLLAKVGDGKEEDETFAAKKGRKNREYFDTKTSISGMLLRDSSLTQKEIGNNLKDINMGISQSEVSRMLKSMNYTRKRLVTILVARQEYSRMIDFVSDENFVYMGETGINLHMVRSYGYSPKNTKAYKVVKRSKGINISLLLAIEMSGILAYQIKDELFNGISFMEYIRNHFIPHFKEHSNDVLIMNNCNFHHRSEVLALLNESNINYRFIPPYPPQLSAIEEYFSHFKSNLKSIQPMTNNRDIMKQKIITCLESENMDFSGWFRNVRKYVERAASRQEFI